MSTAYERYNTGRGERGRAPIRESTFAAMEEVGVFAKDIEAWLEGSTAVYAAKLAKAAEAADYWRSIAPHWGDNDPKNKKPPTGLGQGGTGVPNYPDDYAASIKVTRHDGTVAVGTELMPLAAFLEYGTDRTPAFACGARTLAAFGGGSADSTARITDKLFIG